jgi:Tfp pilus assembly protein PilF
VSPATYPIYRFLEHDNLTEAITLFKYAVTVYSNSWRAFDSLAEAYTKVGQKELAIQNYQKSLKLNPENVNVRETLIRLKN